MDTGPILWGRYMRAPLYHKLTAETVGLWQFDGNLLDSGPYGLDLSITQGKEYYSMMLGPIRGLFNGYGTSRTVAARTIHDPELAITGDITIMYLGTISNGLPGAADIPGVVFGTAGETSDTNYLWSLYGGPTSGLKWFSESGEGVDSIYNPAYVFPGEYHGVCHYAASRQDNVVRLFIDGRKIGTSGTLITPTGGDSSVLSTTTAGLNNFSIASLRIDNVARSDDYIRNTYNTTLGRWKGWRI